MGLAAIPYRISTPRLVLRAYELSDAPNLLRATAADRQDLSRWIDTIDGITDDGRAFAAVRLARGRFDLQLDFAYALTATDGTLLGHVSCHLLDPALVRFSLTYWMYRHARRQGYASEAVAATVEMLFNIGGASRVEAFVDVNNLPGRAFAEGIGLRREGVLHRAIARRGQAYDAVIYAAIRKWREVVPFSSARRMSSTPSMAPEDATGRKLSFP